MKSSSHKIRNRFANLFLSQVLLLTAAFQAQAAYQCIDLLKDSVVHEPFAPKKALTATDLEKYVAQSISKTEEFNFIRAEAKRMGVRVWMFGGTAASYLHYAKWDLARKNQLLKLQEDRFDFDFTNIFRSTQDLDIVVDGRPEQIQAFQNALGQRFPYFVGSKKAWEVRPLRTPIGKPGDGYYKESLLDDPNFSNQNTDTNSLAMVEISESHDPVVRDLRAWNTGKNQFLEDALNNTISYLRNPLHHTTARAKMGQNPEILSVMRLLVKAFQYDLEIDPKSMLSLKEVIAQFNPDSVKDVSALRRMNEIAAKLVMHSSNIERAMNVLDQLGLRQKLLSMSLKDEANDATFWLSKEPLRSFEITKDGKVTELPKYASGLLKTGTFKPTGKTAKDLGIQIVAHETNSFLAYESITKSHSGEPNVLISRNSALGEGADYGDGFYTQTGRHGARGTGLTIRFSVDPNAREGVDFTVHGSYIVFLNKKALTVIQESLNLGIVELVDIVESGKFNLNKSDRGVFEKLKRRLSASRIEAELEKLMNSNSLEDQKKFENILVSMVMNPKIKDLVAETTVTQVVKKVYIKLAALKYSRNERDILRYIGIVSSCLPELIKGQTLTKEDFKKYLSQKRNEDLSAELISLVVIEQALVDGADHFLENLSLQGLGVKVKDVIVEKIKVFSTSTDYRKKMVFHKLSEEKENALEENNPRKLEGLFSLDLLNVNSVSISGHSLLLEAAYYEAQKVIDFLTLHRDFVVNRKNKNGRNDVEELRLLGKDDIADYIESKIGRKISKKIRLKERHSLRTVEYPEGAPIVDSVRIEPGTFKMGKKRKVIVTLTKAFEIMSVDTTNRMWNGIVALANNYLPRQFNSLKEGPSRDKGFENPVESISHEEVTQQWLVALNQLSKLKDKTIQKSLAELLPGHYLGKKYRLPTEAEWEFVSRLAGLATGSYAFGNTAKDADEFAWSTQNSGSITHPVGLKKPVMIGGKPVYDLHGNVWKMMQDTCEWDQGIELAGGVDPLATGGSRWVIRGGSWYNSAQALMLSDSRNDIRPGSFDSGVGFRLASDAP